MTTRESMTLQTGAVRRGNGFTKAIYGYARALDERATLGVHVVCSVKVYDLPNFANLKPLGAL